MPKSSNGDLPTGISLRSDSIVIDFRYRRQRCRETLRNLAPTKPNIKFAERKRAVILTEIAQGTFDYARHFPDSPRADLFSGPSAGRKTVGQALNEWLKFCETTVSFCTLDSYRKNAEVYTRPKFGDRPLDSVTTTDIELWHSVELGGLNPSTIRVVSQPLRSIFARAKKDKLIEHNPMTEVSYPPLEEYEEPDPFTQTEMELLESYDAGTPSEENMLTFALWTGVRVNELIALAWEDVDWQENTVYVRRAKDPEEFKVPKTTRSARKIELLAPARDALLRQRALSEARPPFEIKVRQRGSRRVRKETVKFIFYSTTTNAPFPSTAKYRNWFWLKALRKLKIRMRGPYTTRHTYISQMLTAGMPKEWVIRQVGHKDSKMIDAHYGKWIKEDAPNMVKLANDYFGFGHMTATRKSNK